VVASGSLPPGAPPDFYARACRTAKSWNAKFVLDSSGPALSAALTEGVYLIKPNLRELTEEKTVAGAHGADRRNWQRRGTQHAVAGDEQRAAMAQSQGNDLCLPAFDEPDARLDEGRHVIKPLAHHSIPAPSLPIRMTRGGLPPR